MELQDFFVSFVQVLLLFKGGNCNLPSNEMTQTLVPINLLTL